MKILFKVASAALLCAALLFAASTLASAQQQQVGSARAFAPVMLDDIHYYLSDHAAAVLFFKNHFGAREMQQSRTPLGFITFLNLRLGESSINISPPGPFEGIRVGDPKRWQREVIKPAADLPPIYGVHWLAISTSSLERTLAELEAQGVPVRERNLKLPSEPKARAASVFGPDFTTIAIVERHARRSAADSFAIDHLQLLVRDLAENERFFREVYAGRVVARRPHTSVMRVADALIVLSEPEAFGLRREQVQPRDPTKFRFGIDHIGFLYANVKPAFETAKARGYKFLLEPTVLRYRDQPTVYTFAITFSPDGLQCEMVSEEGRTRPRTKYSDEK